MDTLFQEILNVLNNLIPSALTTDFSGLNEVLAYFITITLVWGIVIRPLLKAVRLLK